MSNTKDNKITKVYTKFEPTRIHFTDLEENKRSKGQKIAYVRYNDKKKGDQTLLLQTPKIILDTYGLPKKGDYYSDEKQRSFIKVPLDQENPEIKIFHDKLSELDTIMDSDEMRTQIFGSLKKSKGWTYQAIVREPTATQIEENSDSDSDNDAGVKETETANTYPRPSYMKAKFNLDWDTGNIETKMYKLVNDEREKVKVTTLESVEELVTYRSTIRLVLMPNKLWAMKAYDGKKYGVTFKIMHLEVEPVERTSLKQYFETDAFIDSGDEDSEDGDGDAQVSTLKTKTKTKITHDLDQDNTSSLKTSTLDLDNDSESDDDDAGDADANDAPPVLKTSASVKGNETDNSDSDDESNSDSSEEEAVVEVKPKKAPPKGGKKKKTANTSA